MSAQIALGIDLRDDATLESFVSGDNDNILEVISNFIVTPDLEKRILVLTGPKGSGKTHLLQATCYQAEDLGYTSIYLPVRQIKDPNSNYLDGMQSINLICIDDAELIIGKQLFEQRLLDFLNSLEINSGKAIIALNESSINYSNSDLQDKLIMSYNMPILPLNDKQKLEAIKSRAQNRGIIVDERVAKFLIRNSKDDLSGLFKHLEKLDLASLEKQRKLTIPFVKDVLNI